MSALETQLDYVYQHEKTRAGEVWLTQPMGGDEIKDLTFGDAMAEVRRMAAHLVSLNLPQPSQIAIFSKNSAWWLMADLAIWMAGHVSVPLYPTLPADQIAQILDHSESKLIFVGKLDGYDAMEPGIPANLPRIVMPLAPSNAKGEKWAAIIARTAPMTASPARGKNELATLIYTSGSTGVPKGVMHSFHTMVQSALGVKNHLGVEPSDRMLSYLPMAHAFERWVVETSTFVTGFHVFFAESLTSFVQDLNRARPTLFISVPRLWLKFQQGVSVKLPPAKLAKLLKIPILRGIIKKKVLTTLGLDQVRFAGSGSAPIPGELIDWYRSLGLELLEGYGMSENFCYSHVTAPGKVRVGYVGGTYPGVQCKLGDGDEILVKSPGNMLGYYKLDEATAESFTEDGFLKTGDRGSIDEEGRLKITGRVKEIFKTSKGKYVAPAPIENRILVHPDVEAACVSGSGMPAAYAMVVLSEEAQKHREARKDEIIQSLAAHLKVVNSELAHHEHLDMIIVITEPWTIESGMLTPTMKLRRNKIEDRYAPMAEGWFEKKEKVLWV